MMHSLRALVLLALLLAGGPVFAGLFDDEVARQQIAEQQKRVDALREQGDTMQSRLTRIEESLKSQPVLEIASQIERLREDMRAMRGQIEVLANGLEQAAKRQRDMYVDLDLRLRRFEQPNGASAGGAAGDAASTGPASSPVPGQPGQGAPATTDATKPGPVTAAETEAYEKAQAHRRTANYAGAITAFQEFIRRFPASALAPRAQYWIGDSYFNQRDYKNAIASQQKLLASYPNSTSVPDAMLNLASSQHDAGDHAGARKTMQALVAQHPKSDAAEKARRRLANQR